jgi:hypothetical protein
MKKKSVSTATVTLIGGVAFFTLGLLVILRLNPIFEVFSQISPSVQVVEAVGVVFQFLGQALVIFGVLRLNSHNLFSSIQADRQIVMDGLSQNINQIQTGYLQTMAKLDVVIANQKAAAIQPKPFSPSNCRYCGAQIEQGRFCPNCGKAN